MNEKSSTYVSKIQTPHQLGKNAAGGFNCEKCGQDWVHEPRSKCPGVKLYGWGKWLSTLLTARQLQELGYDTKLLITPQGCASFNARKQWLWLYRPPARPEDIVDCETGKSMLEDMLEAPIASLLDLGEARGLVLDGFDCPRRLALRTQFLEVSSKYKGTFTQDLSLGKIKRALIKRLLEDFSTGGSHDTCTRAEFEKAERGKTP